MDIGEEERQVVRVSSFLTHTLHFTSGDRERKIRVRRRLYADDDDFEQNYIRIAI